MSGCFFPGLLDGGWWSVTPVPEWSEWMEVDLDPLADPARLALPDLLFY